MDSGATNKGALTKGKILKAAMEHASSFGLSNVSIGEVAKRAGMSRTGVISHFENKEHMQIAILKYCEQEFIAEVIKPAYAELAIKNLENLLLKWRNWTDRLEFSSVVGCPFIKAEIEYQDRPSDGIKDFIQGQQKLFIQFIEKLVKRAQEQNAIRVDADASKVAFEIYAIYVGHAVVRKLNSPQAGIDSYTFCINLLVNKYQDDVESKERFHI